MTRFYRNPCHWRYAASATLAHCMSPNPSHWSTAEVRSAIPGIEWPGVPDRALRSTWPILLQLEHTQWWPPERLREYQWRQLRLLHAHAVRSVPHYRRTLGDAPLPESDGACADAWQALPILTRRDLQDHFADLRSSEYPQGHGSVTQSSSSGSTGAPVRVLKSQVGGLFWQAVSARDHLWHRRDLSRKLAGIKTQASPRKALYPDGLNFPDWGVPTKGFRTGPSAMLNLNARVHEQAEWLQRQRPDYLLSYPSILEALARHCRDERVELAPLLQLRSMSEILRPEVRQICRVVWEVEIKDMYSTEETGYIALQCPESGQMLVQAETVFVEVLDRQRRPCAPGETGEVIVTPLHNFAMPLLRYAIGDLAVAGASAACGRGLPVLERVLGRTRNMIRLPGGAQVFPDYQGVMEGIDCVRQFQVVQHSLTQLEIRLVATRALSADEELRLRRWFESRCRHTFDIRISYHDAIARTRGGKYLDFVSALDGTIPT